MRRTSKFGVAVELSHFEQRSSRLQHHCACSAAEAPIRNVTDLGLLALFQLALGQTLWQESDAPGPQTHHHSNQTAQCTDLGSCTLSLIERHHRMQILT